MFNDRSELNNKDWGLFGRPDHSLRWHECETGEKTSAKFLAAPIISGIDKTLIGVIRVPKTENDSDFTEVDAMMLQSLANHIALSIKNIENYDRQAAILQKTRNLLELGILLQQEKNREKFFHIFLTGLTHGDAIGFNRAIAFKIDTDSNELNGNISIGPINSDKGKIMSKSMHDSREFLDLLTCINAYSQNRYKDDILNREVKNFKDTLEIDKWPIKILNMIKPSKKNEVIKVEKNEFKFWFSNKFISFLTNIESKSIWFTILHIEGCVYEMLLLDNIYDNKDLDTNTNSLLKNFLRSSLETLRSLHQEDRINTLMRVKGERDAWEEVSFRAAHKMGNAFFGLRGDFEWLKIVSQETVIDNDKLKNTINEIENSLKAARSIISEFKRYAKPENITKNSINLNEVLDTSISEIEKAIGDRIKIEKLYEINLPYINLDVQIFKQCIKELIENASNFIKDSGRITITSRIANKNDITATGVDPTGTYLAVSVADTGLGVPEENKTKIFLPFFSTSSQGSGLGLSIAQQHIENHGGRIIENGQYLSGANFLIAIPLQQNN